METIIKIQHRFIQCKNLTEYDQNMLSWWAKQQQFESLNIWFDTKNNFKFVSDHCMDNYRPHYNDGILLL